MTAPGTIPTIDATEADRRLREDPARPVLLDVREINEFLQVRAPGALLVPTSAFVARLGELPPDRPLLVICHPATARRPWSATSPGWGARTPSTSPAAWTPGHGPGCRPAAVRSRWARENSPPAEARG